MSVNTIRPPPTRGIVGPQSGADPEARLRRLLMMGARERERAMRQATPTGATLCLGAQEHSSVATGGILFEVEEKDQNPPHVLKTDEGVVYISTTPGMWSGMTYTEAMKLRLDTPVEKLNATAEDSYKDVAFSSPYCDYRFFVYRCSPLTSHHQIAYYVLARPADDPRVYTFK